MKSAEELQKELDEKEAKHAESIKDLQRKLTEADREKKEILSKIEALEKGGGNDAKIKELEEQIKKSNETIENLSKEKELERLEKRFPEIEPTLLYGKSEEEIETIVSKQKARIEKNYVSRASSHAPVYSNRSEVDDEIEKVKSNSSLDTDAKLAKVRELERMKEAI